MYICEGCGRPFVKPTTALIPATEDTEERRVSICPECGCPTYREMTAEEKVQMEEDEKRRAEERNKRIEEQTATETE